MNNKQNSRIGLITDREGRGKYRLTLIGGSLQIEGEFDEVPTPQSLYRLLPYHPLARRLNTEPTKTQVRMWSVDCVDKRGPEKLDIKIRRETGL